MIWDFSLLHCMHLVLLNPFAAPLLLCPTSLIVVFLFSFSLIHFLKFPLRVLFCLLDYKCCLVSRDFLFVFSYRFYFDSIVVKQYTLHYFSFLKIWWFVLWPRIWPVWPICSMVTWLGILLLDRFIDGSINVS